MEKVQRLRCSKCKYYGLPNLFINSLGTQLKTCVDCRKPTKADYEAVWKEINREEDYNYERMRDCCGEYPLTPKSLMRLYYKGNLPKTPDELKRYYEIYPKNK